MALTATIGKAGSAMFKNRGLIDAENAGGVSGFAAARLRSLGKYASGASFDARGIKIGGKSIGSMTGAGENKKGGFDQRVKARDENRRKRYEGMKINENDQIQKDLHKTQEDLEEAKGAILKDVEAIDKIIETKRQAAADAERDYKADPTLLPQLVTANAELNAAKATKKDMREGRSYSYIDSAGNPAGNATGTGINMGVLEQLERDQIAVIKSEDRKIGRLFAQGLRSPGKVLKTIRFLGAPVTGDSSHQRDITAHTVIMDTKLPDSVAK
jgi:hypothetical protein